MYNHNYKGLPYKKSCKQFIKDHRFIYHLYGKFTRWETKDGEKIMICKLNKYHLERIVSRFGNTYIRTNYPFIWYRYLKLFEERQKDNFILYNDN